MTRTQSVNPSVDLLLTHARWVEGFARALVRKDADDVAQDTWLAALQHPPAANESPRPWFATVMRNAARMRFRSSARRRAREEVAHEQPSSVPTPAEITQRMELQRRLASAVLALDEPNRTTIVLVFYEGMSPAEVARQLGIPATTVRSRVRAALVTLRERLDAEEGGDRKKWQLALAPLLAPRTPAASALPLLAIAALLIVAAVAVVLVVVMRTTSSSSTSTSASTSASAPSAQTAMPPSSATTPAPTLDATPATTTGAQPSLMAFVSRALGRDDDDDVQPGITPAFLRAQATFIARVDECYELAHRAGRDLRGKVRLDVKLTTRPEVDAEIAIVRDETTIRDPETLECLVENPTAIEEHLERLRARGERIEGPIVMHVTREMPPPAPKKDVWPDDNASPSCPDGTRHAGTHRKHQWCEKPDGTKHGPEWTWDAKGRLVFIGGYDDGETQNSLRMRDPDSE